MRPTRQLWGVGVLATLLAGLAAVFARPLLLAATVLIGAWLLVRQYLFLAAVRETVASLSVTQAPATSAVRTGESTPVAFEATLDRPRSLALSIAAGLPTAGVADEPLELSLEPGEAGGRKTTSVRWPVAGRHRFEAATLTATDGLFETTLEVGSTPRVTVEPRGPRSVHVGKGGDRTAIAQGEHEAGRFGSGTDPAEIREYIPGDAADKIDWKATARLDTLHVREFEVDTDRPTVLIVDHRDALSTGPAAETKFAYLREAALATAASARRLGDPIGLLSVGDEGLTTRFDPATGPGHYMSIRRRLLDLEPTETGQPSPSGEKTVGVGTIDERYADGTSAAGKPDRSGLFGVPDRGPTRSSRDAFTRTLEPFYAAHQYRTRFESDPLLGAVQTAAGKYHDRAWTIIFTDDSEPEALYEAVRYARSRNNDVLVLLTPSALFAHGGLADVERAYDRYQRFESFRQKLDRLDRVTALEVAPADRLATVLGAGRDGVRTRGGVGD